MYSRYNSFIKKLENIPSESDKNVSRDEGLLSGNSNRRAQRRNYWISSYKMRSQKAEVKLPWPIKSQGLPEITFTEIEIMKDAKHPVFINLGGSFTRLPPISNIDSWLEKRHGEIECIPLCMIEYFLNNMLKSWDLSDTIIQKTSTNIISTASWYINSYSLETHEDMLHYRRGLIYLPLMTHGIVIICQPFTEMVLISIVHKNNGVLSLLDAKMLTIAMSKSIQEIRKSPNQSGLSLQCSSHRTLFRSLKTEQQWHDLKNWLPKYVTRDFPDDNMISRIFHHPGILYGN